MTVLLVIHIIVVLMLIIVILMQRSSSDGFTGGGSGGMDGFMTGRGKANLLSRTTSILATIFIVNSIILAYVSSNRSREESVIKQIEIEQQQEKQEDQKPVVPLAD